MSQVRDYGIDGGAAPTLLDTSATGGPHIDMEANPQSPTGSVRMRKPMRSNTVKTYRPERRGRERQPGQEPGIDTKSSHPLHTPQLYEDCQITVVDFSQEDIHLQHLDNRTLEPCIAKGRPDWGMTIVFAFNFLYHSKAPYFCH